MESTIRGWTLSRAVLVVLSMYLEVSAQLNTITVHDNTVTNRISRYMTGACMEDVNHEVYGGIYSQMLFGESFQEPPTDQLVGFQTVGGNWTAANGEVSVNGNGGPKIVADNTICTNGEAGVDVYLDGSGAGPSGLIIKVGSARAGADNFTGYEIGLSNGSLRIGKHENNFSLIKDVTCNAPVGEWVNLKVKMTGSSMIVFVNNDSITSHTDILPIQSGAIGLRAWSDATTRFRNFWVNTDGSVRALSFEATNGQVSGMWRGLKKGNANGSFSLPTQSPFKGAQSQMLSFTSGDGEIGIENQGLNRQGLYLQSGKQYEGYVWVKVSQATDVSVALESSDGATVAAEISLRATSSDWERLDFTLTPNATLWPGRFVIKLKQTGSITIGHAFLQPGEWGRFEGLPIRKDVAEGLIAQKATILRYGGCMAQHNDYRWKDQIGPRDLRPMKKGWWYDYSSMGWGIIDFLNFCEKTGILGIPNFSHRDSGQSMADFIEYVNGPAASIWGAKRVADGHPEPYNLKYLQFGNEEHLNDGYYYPAFEATAKAVWAEDPNIIIVVGDFGYHNVITDPYNFTGGDGCNSLATHKKILDLARQYNREVWFDIHTWTEHLPEPRDLPAALSFYDQLGTINPGAKYKLVCFEFNAASHDVQRALCNAHGINELERVGDKIVMTSSANCLQVDGQNDNGWDQGLLFMNPQKVWAQPPYYVTQMVSEHHQPLCLSAEVKGNNTENLDVTMTRSEDGKIIVAKIVNMGGTAAQVSFNFDSFNPQGKPVSITTLAGGLDQANTAQNATTIIPAASSMTGADKQIFTLSGYSFIVIQFGADETNVRSVKQASAPALCVRKTTAGFLIQWNHPLAGQNPIVQIMDLRGALIKEMNLKYQANGIMASIWDGTSVSGHPAASGSYVFAVRLEDEIVGRFAATIVNR
jgi:alpha-L-arabinofuranosidase